MATEWLNEELLKRKIGHRLMEILDGLKGRFSYLRVESLESLIFLINNADSTTLRIIGELQTLDVPHYKVWPLIERILRKREEVDLEHAKSTREERMLCFRALFGLFGLCRAKDPSGTILDFVMQFIADRKDDNAVLVEAVETIMAILDANPTFRQSFRSRPNFDAVKSYLRSIFDNEDICKQFKLLLGSEL